MIQAMTITAMLEHQYIDGFYVKYQKLADIFKRVLSQ